MLSLRPFAVCLSVALVIPVGMAQTRQPPAAQAKAAAAPAPELLWIGDLDTDHDGRISMQEVGKRPVIANSFAAMDLNHDGVLVNSEVQVAWQQFIARTYAQQRPVRLQRFDEADTNKDGKLMPEEAKAGLPRITANFAVLDTNKDGWLSHDEVAVAGQLFYYQDIAQWHQRNAQAFAQLDANHDGKLSRPELQAKFPQLANSFAFLDENHDGSLGATEFTLPLK